MSASSRISSALDEIVKRELPAHLSAELQEVLKAGADATLLVEQQKVILATAHEDSRLLNERIKVLTTANEAWAKLEADLQRREKAVSKIEYDLFEAKLRKETAEIRAAEMRDLVGLVFRSPVFSTAINEQGSCYDSQRGFSNNFSSSRTIDQTQK